MTDRRKARRIIITCIAEVSPIEENYIQEGYVTSISRTGLGVFLQRPIKAKNEVNLKLSFFSITGIKDIENIRGTVVWGERMRNVYHIGIQFARLDPKKDAELISYLDSAEKNFSF